MQDGQCDRALAAAVPRPVGVDLRRAPPAHPGRRDATGSRIREVELAQELGVSRGPVRESDPGPRGVGTGGALPRQPSYVAPVVASDVRDVYSLRSAIEVLAVREAMAGNLDELKVLLAPRARAFESHVHASMGTTEIVEADIAFHSVFYELAGNPRLLGVWNSITDPLRSMMRLATKRDDPHWQDSYEQHAAIAGAVFDGATDRAVELVLRHPGFGTGRPSEAGRRRPGLDPFAEKRQLLDRMVRGRAVVVVAYGQILMSFGPAQRLYAANTVEGGHT